MPEPLDPSVPAAPAAPAEPAPAEPTTVEAAPVATDETVYDELSAWFRDQPGGGAGTGGQG